MDVDMKGNIEEGDTGTYDFYYYIKILWKYRLVIFIITFLAGLTSVIYVITSDKYYKSVVTLYPITKDQGGPLKELAATLGIGVKPEGYYLPDVIHSRRIMKKVIERKYKTEAFKDSVNLIQFWNYDEMPVSENLKYEYAMRALSLATNLREDKETALITLTIVTKERKLSADIAQSYVDMITYYLQNELKTQIRQSINFTSTRLEEVKNELYEEEQGLLKFQESNAKLSSPFLSLQVKRMYKKIELTTDLEVLLKKQLELLKIEEERLKPVMNILDAPDIYEKHVKPKGRKIATVSTFLAFLLSYGFSIYYEKVNFSMFFNKIKQIIKKQL